MTKIFKVMVVIGPKIELMDAINHENGVWLVPEWYEAIPSGELQPARIIRIDQLPQSPAPPNAGAAFVLNEILPKALFDVRVPLTPGGKYEAQDLPRIRLSADGTPLEIPPQAPLTRQ